MPSGHLSRQLRFVLPGAATTYWLHTPSVLARIWADAAPLARFVDFFETTSVTSITLLIPSQTLGRPLSSLGSLDHRPVLVYPLDPSHQGHPPKRASRFPSCISLVHTIYASLR